jgi:hypothetical protein
MITNIILADCMTAVEGRGWGREREKKKNYRFFEAGQVDKN